jgi:putative transcriptional regulator
MSMPDINRLKVVLAEKKLTNKWLAERLDVNPNTVSAWCTNSKQPSVETFYDIALLLKIDIRDLFNPTPNK